MQALANKGLDNDTISGLSVFKESVYMQVFVVTKGGPGSGHHGHEGRPGQRGGSAPNKGTPDLIAVSPTKSKKYLVEIKSSWPEKTDRREMAESVFDERAELDDEIHVAKDSSGGTVAVMTLDDDEEEGVVWLNILATRQKGYGRFMIKRAAEKAAEKGLGLKLIATEKAKSFYRKIGMRGTSNTFIFTQDDCKNISRVLKSDIIDKFNSVSADDEPDDGVFCVPRKKATKILVVEKGGQGSGHFGHEGRPGERGGSAPSAASTEAFLSMEKQPTASQSKKWAKKFQKDYDNDENFRAAVKTAVLYTGGSFKEVSAVDRYLTDGTKPMFGDVALSMIPNADRPDDLQDSGAKSIDLDTVAIGDVYHPMAEYGSNPFEPNADASDRSIKDATEALSTGISEMNRALNSSEGYSGSLYRGMTLISKDRYAYHIDEEKRLLAESSIDKVKRQYRENSIKRTEREAEAASTILSAKVGDKIKFSGLTSFTTRESVADEFSWGKNAGQRNRGGLNSWAIPVVIEVQPGAKALNVSRFSRWNQAEALTKGSFEVVDIQEGKEWGGKSYHATKRIVVKQLAVKSADAKEFSYACSFFPALGIELGGDTKKKKEDAMLKKLVIKSDEKRLVFGEVYAPLRVDTDNEAMTAEQIERMAHNFLAKGRLWKVDTSHNLKMSGCVVVESFIARKNDPDGFIEGSWVLGVKVLPDDLWSAVKSGELNGFSFYGMVEKRAMKAKVIATKRLTGKTELSTDGSLPPHAHDVDMMFGENGAVIECETAEELGHTHKITQATATKASKDHSHRLIISE